MTGLYKRLNRTFYSEYSRVLRSTDTPHMSTARSLIRASASALRPARGPLLSVYDLAAVEAAAPRAKAAFTACARSASFAAPGTTGWRNQGGQRGTPRRRSTLAPAMQCR